MLLMCLYARIYSYLCANSAAMLGAIFEIRFHLHKLTGNKQQQKNVHENM